MYCMHCGKSIEADSKFCPNCGGKIADSNVGSVTDTVKKMTDSAVNTAKSAGNAIMESATGKIDSEAVKDTFKKATGTAVNLAKSAKNVANDIKQPIEKAEGNNKNGNSDSVNTKSKTDRKNTIIGLIVVCLAVILLFKGCGAIFGGSKGEKLAKNIVSASYDCKIKSVTTIIENDKTEISIYVVKFVPAEGEEHSALVQVISGTAMIDGVYSKNNYDELNREIESWKLINEIGNKQN